MKKLHKIRPEIVAHKTEMAYTESVKRWFDKGCGMLTSENVTCAYSGLLDEDVVHLSHLGDADATEVLVDRYRPMVESKARTYFVQGADRDDVVQEGMIGLCKAIRDFREERSNRFRAFAELCVTRQIISAVKAATRHKHVPLNGSLSLNQTLGDDQADCTYMDVISASDATNPEAIMCGGVVPRDFMEVAERKLSSLEMSVLRCYLDGKSYQEISSSLHCHTKSIDNALQRVKRKMQFMLTS